MTRRPRPTTLKTIYRKTKIVLTCRGRKVFEHADLRACDAFKRGFYESQNERLGR